MAHNSIYSEVRHLKFKGLESFECGKMLEYISLSNEISPNFRYSPIRGLVKMFYEIFIEQVRYEVSESKGSPKVLFAFNEFGEGRPDSFEMLRDLYNCASDATLVYWVKSSSLVPVKEIARYLYYSFIWLKQLKNTWLSLGQKTIVVNRLLMFFNLQRKLKVFSNYSAIVVRYDAQTYDNIVCQLFRNMGKKTITAQHGVCIASSEGSILYGHEFRLSVSDYFMAWNKMTKSEAIREGMSEDKIKICGIARCINAKQSRQNNNGIIGVLLDGWGLDYNNKALIQIANEYCKKHHYKYILRYHPFFKGDEYNDYIDSTFYIGNSKESMDEYANKVEFTIMGGSAALLELLYKRHKTYVYSIGANTDFFYRYIDVFQDLNGLEMLLSADDYSEDIYDQLVTVQDAKASYTYFFKQVAQGSL